ncbi:hypothetical protein AMTR_s00037p00078930 [Amborella trichopoda]|uniref:Uncharacterized protein n=1 Tax=Amborella trichopoda TaxID=13333 RepID=U5D7B6_AMBTC|nr:hypothetical protein AMTR_s00037p00078930 [Amborella trichopoda]
MGRDGMFDLPDQQEKIEWEESYLLSIDLGRQKQMGRDLVDWKFSNESVPPAGREKPPLIEEALPKAENANRMPEPRQC